MRAHSLVPDSYIESSLVKHASVKNYINKRHMILEFEKN